MAGEDTNPAIETVQIRRRNEALRVGSILAHAAVIEHDADGYTADDVRLLIEIIDVDGTEHTFSMPHYVGYRFTQDALRAADQANTLVAEASV